MNFHQSSASLFIPDGIPEEVALGRITHLGIGAHQDDLEFMAFHGIVACYNSNENYFGGVTCTNGAGSARTGPYAGLPDEELQKIRHQEQEAAAVIGHYGVMIQLDFPSKVIQRSPAALEGDLKQILEQSKPEIVYTHNPADKHDTHVAVAVATIRAIRELPPEQRPRQLHGCEVWRGLDWMDDDDKILHDVTGYEELASSLNRLFVSQIEGGKRYDLAITGRRQANATLFQSHAVDGARQVAFAMDLTPLVKDTSLDIVDYVGRYLAKFEADVRGKLSRLLDRR
jgi:LmbE family N-acetylglucosaminyl deacetylase